MQVPKLTQLLIDLHAGLPRLGPGSEAATRQALALCKALPVEAEILDIGCGCGAQTLVLAAACRGGRLIAMDLFPEFVHCLRERLGPSDRAAHILPLVADMRALPFPERSFDLIWCEGAVYNMGFDHGLACWHPLLRPGGYLVLSELSWFKPHPPAELLTYWQHNYPAMRGVAENLTAANRLGWRAVNDFALPISAWHQNYYAPLQQRFSSFLQAHPDDADARTVVEMTRQEISMLNRYPDEYGYQFYILRRRESA